MSTAVRKIAFLTDVEGRWDKLADFCAGNPLVALDAAGALRVADDAVFVFGGDVCDRGPDSQRLAACFLAARAAQPERIVLLAGNRDINKLRLARELTGRPPRNTPPELAAGPRAPLLQHILANTMGARRAYEFRRAELAAAGQPADDDALVDSYLADVAPNGLMTRYLAAAALAHREGETLFVHGGVTADNLGVVPGRAGRASTVDAWVGALNEFHAAAVEAFGAGRVSATGAPLWEPLIAYQAPLPGTRVNQTSVVYARPTDERGDPVLPPEPVIASLRADGVRRVVVGHTPSGDCPAILRDGLGFELVLADNSYGRVERGARVTIDGAVLRIEGVTTLDSGEEAGVLSVLDADAPVVLGQRDPASRRLVKGQLARGGFLGFRAKDGYEVEQVALTDDDLAGLALIPPR